MNRFVSCKCHSPGHQHLTFTNTKSTSLCMCTGYMLKVRFEKPDVFIAPPEFVLGNVLLSVNDGHCIEPGIYIIIDRSPNRSKQGGGGDVIRVRSNPVRNEDTCSRWLNFLSRSLQFSLCLFLLGQKLLG